MIATDEILINSFFAFFYCLGWVVDYIWAGGLVTALILTITRLIAKQE
jgi:hypothetical protein